MPVIYSAKVTPAVASNIWLVNAICQEKQYSFNKPINKKHAPPNINILIWLWPRYNNSINIYKAPPVKNNNVFFICSLKHIRTDSFLMQRKRRSRLDLLSYPKRSFYIYLSEWINMKGQHMFPVRITGSYAF